MDHFKTSLRLLIATGSVMGFFGGWVMLAHAGKPVAAVPPAGMVEAAPLPTLAPLPDLNNPATRMQPLQPMPLFSAASPRLRTRGS